MSALVIQTSFLGDMVLTTPLLSRLAEQGPVDVVATPANAALLVGHPAVRDIIVYDKRGGAKGWRGLMRTARAVRWREDGQRRGASVAYLAQGSLRTATLAVAARIPVRVGFATSAGRALYTHRVPYDRTLHHAQRLWQLASVAGAPGASPLSAKSRDAHTVPTVRPSLYPSAADDAAAATLLNTAGLSPGTPFVVLAPGSVWGTKRWPGFPALVEALASDARTQALRVVVVGGSADGELARQIAESLESSGRPLPIDATGRLSLLASAALIRRASAIVSNDSLPLHLASAMNTPTVALFGPTVPDFGFGPLAEQASPLGVHGLACRPCHPHGLHTCPQGHFRCMRELTASVVLEAVVHHSRTRPR